MPLHAAAKCPAGFYGCTLTCLDSCHPVAYRAAVVCCIGSDPIARKCFRVPAASLPGLAELYREQMLQVWVFVIQAPLLRAAIIPDFAGCMQTCLPYKDIPWYEHMRAILRTWSLGSCARVRVLCIQNTRGSPLAQGCCRPVKQLVACRLSSCACARHACGLLAAHLAPAGYNRRC